MEHLLQPFYGGVGVARESADRGGSKKSGRRGRADGGFRVKNLIKLFFPSNSQLFVVVNIKSRLRNEIFGKK